MMTSWQRYARDRPRIVNVTVILLLFVLSATGSLFSGLEPSGDWNDWWPGVLLAAVSCTALLWHRSHPRTVVALTAVCAAISTALGYLITPLLLAPAMAALYWLANDTDRKTARAYFFAVVALLLPVALLVDPYDHPLPLKTIGPAAWLVIPVAYGTAGRLRRAYLEVVHARAEQAERTRVEETRHRIAEERMRIARELHDVVAHHLALANAQAGTAAHLTHSQPDQARKMLTELAGTTSSALRELKATVRLLRQPNEPDASLEPAPGLKGLDDLTSAFASAGLTVTVTLEGEEQRLSPGVDLTAFRIVQEALTNVTKHSAANAARVRLLYFPDWLTITVTDDGGTPARTPPAPGHGFGLIGMCERAQSIGGHLQAGHRPQGGFEVTTELPIRPQNLEEARKR